MKVNFSQPLLPGGLRIEVKLMLVAAALSPTALFAQPKKEEPPPTAISASAYSSQTAARQDTLRQKGKPQLELPEVFIFGKDAQLRVTGSKAAPRGIPVLRNEEIARRRIEAVPTTLPTKGNPPQSPQPSGNNVQLYAAGGNYSTFDAKVILRNSRNLLRYGIDGLYERSDGQFENAQYAKMGAAAKALYPLSSTTDLFFNAGFQNDRYGAYGAILSGGTRNVNVFEVSTSLESTLSPSTSLSARYDINFLDLKTDTSDSIIAEVDNRSHHLDVQLATRYSRLNIALTASYYNDVVKYPDSTESEGNSLVQFDLVGGFFIGEKSKVSAGCRFQNLTFPAMDGRNVLAPHARLYLSLSSRMALDIEAETGYSYDLFAVRWQKNPYLNESLSLAPVRTTLGIRAKSEYVLSDMFTFDFEFQRGWYDDYWYWQRDTLNGFFNAVTIDDIDLAEVSIGLRGRVLGGLSLDTRFRYNMSSFEQDGISGVKRDIPYRPEIEFPMSLIYQFDAGTKFTLTSNWIGPRVATFADQQKLGSYIALNTAISRKIGRYITLTARADNILNQKYSYWQGYEEIHIRFLIGAIATF